MFAHDFAPTQASFGKAARAQSIRPSHDSAGSRSRNICLTGQVFLEPSQPVAFASGRPRPTKLRQSGRYASRGTPPLPMQAKLEVGAVDDPLEREADRIAAQVTRAPSLSRHPIGTASE